MMLLRALVIFTIFAIHSGGSHAADAIRCNCLFAQSSGYVGFGTRAVCSTFTEKNKGSGETCQIAFGGTGYQEPMLSKLKLDPKEYRDRAFALTMSNLAAIHDRAPEKIATSEFLRNAVPAFMRATYLRAEARLDDGTLIDLDREVTAVSAEYSGQIADVFLGRAAPFERSWRDKHRLSVQRGAVLFVYAETISLTAVFFDPEQR